jgi:prepilin peptidase CpaA
MGHLPYLAQFAVLAFAALCIASAVSDVRNLTIPNRYCLSIALLYPVHVLATGQGVDWLGGLIVAAGILVAGFLLFAFKLLGAGDAKFMAAIGLWAGPDLFVHFLIITALGGGLMSVTLWLRHRASRTPALSLLGASDVDPEFVKQPMPYGVPVAAGALYVAFTLVS